MQYSSGLDQTRLGRPWGLWLAIANWFGLEQMFRTNQTKRCIEQNRARLHLINNIGQMVDSLLSKINFSVLGKKIYTNYFLTTGPRFNKLHIQGAIWINCTMNQNDEKVIMLFLHVFILLKGQFTFVINLNLTDRTRYLILQIL